MSFNTPMRMPGMMYRGYPPPPGIGMMPQTMRMPMMPPRMVNSQHDGPNKAPPDPPKNDDDKAPVTTVFVGNISERAPDNMIKQMLLRCGNVLSWKRVQGASGVLQAFGFCEYEAPEATLRCIRLLNEWSIADKNLVVKVDAKTKTQLDEYKRKKKVKEQASNKDDNKEEGEVSENANNEDALDEFTLCEDRVAKAGLDHIMTEYKKELNKTPPSSTTSDDKEKHLREKRREAVAKMTDPTMTDKILEDMDLGEDKRNVISREIRIFRDQHKGEGDTDPDGPNRDRDRDRDRGRRFHDSRDSRSYSSRESRDMHRDSHRGDSHRSESHRSESHRSDSHRSERDSHNHRDSHREVSRRDVHRVDSRSRSRSISRDRESDRHDRTEDVEDAYERKRLERKLREKEAAYQERLKNWQARERKMNRGYEKEIQKDDLMKLEEAKEARRLKEFLQDYDDERDDLKFYKDSALQRRMKEREKEMETDERDRQKEKQEIAEIRRRLQEEGDPDIEQHIARLEREKDEHLLPRLQKSPEPHVDLSIEPVLYSDQQQVVPPSCMIESESEESDHAEQEVIQHEPERQDSYRSNRSDGRHSSDRSRSSSDVSDHEEDTGYMNENDSDVEMHQDNGHDGSESPDQAMPHMGGSRRRKMNVSDVFNQDDDEAAGDISKKRKLVPLDYDEKTVKAPTTAEEKRKCIKNLIDSIPTVKEDLFAYQLDWTMVDSTLMDRRIKPWVNKKIVEYIGEEEPSLTDFICQKVMAHSVPSSILTDVAMVLDEEAEVFVIKMWRLLIYETEAKKAGLVK